MGFLIFIGVLILLVIIGAIAGVIGAIAGATGAIANEIREDNDNI